MARAARHIVSFVLAVAVLPVVLSEHAEAQTGESVIAWHVTIAPSWFDPSAAPAQITPFGILYALHDSVVRPLYGAKVGPGLAEAWSESPDGLTYEFRLRRGLKFHNGDPDKAEDVKFSFDRYNGADLHALGRDGIPVVELEPTTQPELVRQAVRTLG